MKTEKENSSVCESKKPWRNQWTFLVADDLLFLSGAAMRVVLGLKERIFFLSRRKRKGLEDCFGERVKERMN